VRVFAAEAVSRPSVVSPVSPLPVPLPEGVGGLSGQPLSFYRGKSPGAILAGQKTLVTFFLPVTDSGEGGRIASGPTGLAPVECGLRTTIGACQTFAPPGQARRGCGVEAVVGVAKPLVHRDKPGGGYPIALPKIRDGQKGPTRGDGL
jgi:hypothetical protein